MNKPENLKDLSRLLLLCGVQSGTVALSICKELQDSVRRHELIEIILAQIENPSSTEELEG